MTGSIAICQAHSGRRQAPSFCSESGMTQPSRCYAPLALPPLLLTHSLNSLSASYYGLWRSIHWFIIKCTCWSCHLTLLTISLGIWSFYWQNPLWDIIHSLQFKGDSAFNVKVCYSRIPGTVLPHQHKVQRKQPTLAMLIKYMITLWLT